VEKADAKRRIPGLLFILAGALLGYIGAGSTLWAYQERLVFEPDRSLHAKPSDFPFAVLEAEVPVQSPGQPQQKLRAWWVPSGKPGAKVVLYLHGNDGNVSTSVREIAPLRELGYSVFMIDYRGYGASDGRFPSESTVYEDAEAAWRYLTCAGCVEPAKLYIYGHSLGGAVAIELGRRHPEAAGLIVESSFTSIHDMAMLDLRYAWLPVRQFLTHKFESIRKVGELQLPVLYIHGTADDVVPHAMGRKLFEASGGDKRFVAIDGGRHEHDAAALEPLLRAALRDFVQ
jgi:alpha-beta hydrolase superfamily lysophospholipase